MPRFNGLRALGTVKTSDVTPSSPTMLYSVPPTGQRRSENFLAKMNFVDFDNFQSNCLDYFVPDRGNNNNN